jgi:predicted ATPase
VGVWLIDLAPLADARLVPSAVAQVLGFDIRSDDPVPGLVGALRDRRLVLVFDNCEHVIEAAATLVVAILRGAAGVDILATSREPLRVEGENVQRLPRLGRYAADVQFKMIRCAFDRDQFVLQHAARVIHPLQAAVDGRCWMTTGGKR